MLASVKNLSRNFKNEQKLNLVQRYSGPSLEFKDIPSFIEHDLCFDQISTNSGLFSSADLFPSVT